MIGNDIIDLQLAKKQSNWQRKGWLQKIFTTTEQKYILSSKDPELQVWLFWSMKEAAYKGHQRRFSLPPKLNPKDFKCALDGMVSIDRHLYYTESEMTQYYIHTTAKSPRNNYYSSICKKDTDIYQSLTQSIRQKLNIQASIFIQKDTNRIPMVYINKKESDIQISISNHGMYSAFILNV
ncbi:4'-phosphopantetheinyl transferase family protein [Aquimarina mytili]|uniref:4-phosphopantetheinyl transferase family protein n=1 Tax=Aquimarina mytili TaxID=874423 RepID=A0A937D7D1_9FLAO|nr:4'-phosphopantetheinyl transferase superfamily protein [Aquimarina mytili]MBL0682960.1 4-phosphopantetheinyl transferase family protein [Aquimarina mytili]